MTVSRELHERTVALLKFLPYSCEPPDGTGALPCKAHQPNEKSRWTCDLSIHKIYKYTITFIKTTYNQTAYHNLSSSIFIIFLPPISLQDFGQNVMVHFSSYIIQLCLFILFNIFFIFLISAQIAFIQNVGHLSQKRVPGRWDAQNLKCYCIWKISQSV